MTREKRTDNRVDVAWSARVAKRGLGVTSGQVRNASISGIYVETTLALVNGDHVLLEIKTGSIDETAPILCEALIVRKQEIAQTRSHGYGMQFTRIDDDALQRMLTLVTELWLQQQSDHAPN